MKVRVSLSMAATAILAFSLFTGCGKAFDYIKNHPGQNAQLCRVQKLIIPWQSGLQEVKIVYNSADNPLHMLITNSGGMFALEEFHFRYDKYNRLTDYLFNYYGGTGAVVWHRYYYPDKKTVIDTSYAYTGLITDPVPPHGNFNRVTIFSLDASGRIIKTTEPSQSPGFPDLITNFTYDAHGNQVRPGTTYDNKINAFQTNKVWMFIYNDYSVNNPNSHPYQPVFIQITDYNQAGLPTKLTNNGSVVQGIIFGNAFNNMEIVYDCDLSQLPDKY